MQALRGSMFVSRLLSLNACRLHAQGRSCHGHVTSGESSILRSPSHRTCGQDVDPVPETLKPCVRQTSRHACNADDSAFAPASKSKDTKCFEALDSHRPSQTPHISVRSKVEQKSQHATALELLHRKLSLLELEHVSLCDATIIARSRAFKSTSFEHLAAVLKALKERLGSSEIAAQALAANPVLLSQPIELLEQKLKVMADFGITELVVRKLWTSNQRALTLNVESLHTKLSFFKENGLNAEALNRLLYRHPGVLRRSPVLHIVNFLKSLGMVQSDLLRSVWMHPSFLWVSVDKLRAKYEVFRQLGFSENEYIKTICAGLPRLSIEKLQASIKLFKDRGFSDSDVHKLISMHPAIIRVNLETLKSKLDFLLCKQKYGMADIVEYPVCLFYSLQGRLIPRFNALEEKGLSKVYRLSTILACNELRFQKYVKRRRK